MRNGNISKIYITLVCSGLSGTYSDTIQIYEGCQYGFTPLNSSEHKSDCTFEEEIVDYGY